MGIALMAAVFKYWKITLLVLLCAVIFKYMFRKNEVLPHGENLTKVDGGKENNN